MFTPEEAKAVEGYSSLIRQQYDHFSRVANFAIVEIEDKESTPGYLQIASKHTIPRHSLIGSYELLTHPYAEHIAMSELQYVIDELTTRARLRNPSDTEPTRSNIDNAIRRIWRNTRPNFMIVPISFYVSMHAWGAHTLNAVIRYKDGQAYYMFDNAEIAIYWSNKFVALHSIILSNSRNAKWRFKPSQDRYRHRLLVLFEEHGDQVHLLTKTVFRFFPPPDEQIATIDFPKELTEIKSK